MKFTNTAAALGSLLCAGTTLAGGSTKQRVAARRQPSSPLWNSHPNMAKTSMGANGATATSPNWAGALIQEKGYDSATGTITVPSVSGADDAQGAAWVGIDGDGEGCNNILQTGVTWSGDGTYSAWYEWYPYPSYQFEDLSISSGDSIRMTVNASSTTSGSVLLENLTQGSSASQDFTGMDDYPLCENTAEWIVEDFSTSGKQVPFADFGTVKFTKCSATQDGGSKKVDLAGAAIINAKPGDDVLSDCSATSSEVTCDYVPPQ